MFFLSLPFSFKVLICAGVCGKEWERKKSGLAGLGWVGLLSFLHASIRWLWGKGGGQGGRGNVSNLSVNQLVFSVLSASSSVCSVRNPTVSIVHSITHPLPTVCVRAYVPDGMEWNPNQIKSIQIKSNQINPSQIRINQILCMYACNVGGNNSYRTVPCRTLDFTCDDAGHGWLLNQ